MKTFNYKRKNLIKTFGAIFGLSCVCLLGGLGVTASAETLPTVCQTSLYQPASPAEYKQLSTPTDAYYFDGNYAIINDNSNDFLFYDAQSGDYVEDIATGFNTLKQVKKLDQNTLLISGHYNALTIKKIDLSTKTAEPIKENGADIGGNYFDVFSNLLVTVSNNELNLYTYKNGAFTKKAISNLVNSNKPVSINENEDIFYVNNVGQLVKSKVSSTPPDAPEVIHSSAPKAFISNKNFLYFLTETENKLFVIDLNSQDYAPKEIALPQSDFDLGKLENAVSLCFKGENLLITDSTLNSIQEFSVVDSDGALSLEFTGFAIAKGKSAFNRLSNAVLETEKNGDVVATLDANRLTVITQEDGTQKYKNYLFNKEQPTLSKNSFAISSLTDAQSFALGNSTAIVYGNVSGGNKIYQIDLETGVKTDLASIENFHIIDLCFQSGSFYFMTRDGVNNVNVYKMPENTTDKVAIMGVSVVSTEVKNLTVDVYGNVYIHNGNVIHKFTKTQDGYSLSDVTDQATGTKKLITDLNGALYALHDGNKIVRY